MLQLQAVPQVHSVSCRSCSTISELTYDTNAPREGVYVGAMTMAGKLMRASVVFILGQVLAAFGFVSGASTQPQSPRWWQKRRCF